MNELDKILNGWKINNNYSIFLLKNIEESWFSKFLYKGGRNIDEQFDHIIRMRLMWSSKINNKLGKETKIKTNNKYDLKKRLIDSSERVVETLINLSKTSSIEFEAFTLYTRLIAHEAHHRSQIIAIIKVNELAVNPSVNYGLWSWGHNFNK